MLIPGQLRRYFLISQPIVKVLLGCLLMRVLLLPHSHHFVQLLRMNFSNILHHHRNVFGVVLALEFVIIGSILEHDGLAQELGARGAEDIPALLQGFVVVLVISDHHPETTHIIKYGYLLRLCQSAHWQYLRQFCCLSLVDLEQWTMVESIDQSIYINTIYLYI